jgi:hypothetical protein
LIEYMSECNIYPGWCDRSGLSDELRGQLDAFDAECAKKEAAGHPTLKGDERKFIPFSKNPLRHPQVRWNERKEYAQMVGP